MIPALTGVRAGAAVGARAFRLAQAEPFTQHT